MQERHLRERSALPIDELTVERQCAIAYELWMTALTATVFTCLREHGQELITELEQKSVARHQEKYFFAGLAKVGLESEPNDVRKCARYHYFSNTLGGLPMHYVEETSDKVWIRYLAPYWMGDGRHSQLLDPPSLAPNSAGRLISAGMPTTERIWETNG